MTLGLVGCGSKSSSDSDKDKDKSDKAKVGVSMPTKDLQRWNQDGSNIKKQLEKAGYTVDLQYANNDVNTQVSQLENMLSSGCKALVIAAIDGESLGTPLATAKEQDVKVIAYDRLIRNTDAVSYYTSFDNYKVGQAQGTYLKDTLKLDTEKGPFNIELFAGDPGDNNAQLFFNGAMDVLQPYIDKGVLVVQSKQTKFAQVATADWNTEKAQSRMEAIISSDYADKDLDAVMCSNDSTALGVENALASAYKGKYPLITGQDCDIANVKNLVKDKQAMDIFKDTRVLADQAVKMVNAVLKGEEPEVNDTKTYNNGKMVVPSYLCDIVTVSKDNYQKVLIDSGYYKEADLK
ncbi:MAG: sugar-binding protein [Lachnospiraceae bacterium]|nr:sugar-binding protein [Lachnospiraceae bacterium]